MPVAALVVCAALMAGTLSGADNDKARMKTYLKTKLDPTAEQVELFEGMDKGDLQAYIITKDEHEGFAFIENHSDKPLTVKIPDAVIAVQNLKQFGGGGGGFGGGGMGGMGGGGMGGMGGGGMGGMGGQNQGMGGGMGGGGMGGQGMGGMGGGGMGGGGQFGGGGGGGFFSIPPQARVRLSFNSVCLEHAVKPPRSGYKYQMMPLENGTKNEHLKEVLRMVATGSIPSGIAQAATWHLTDGLTFEELAHKKQVSLVGHSSPMFTTAELINAQKMLVLADQRVKLRKQQENTKETPESLYTREELKR
jgi:hypothetical protein